MLKKLPGLASTFNLQLITRNLFLLLFTVYCLLFTNFSSVFAQENKSSFIKVKDLQVNDVVFVRDGDELKPEKIVEKKWVGKPVEVYNLTVGGDQTYFANDLAVHNKAEALRAYFFWDIDGDGCHDDTTATITHARYRTYCDNVDTRNPGAELVEPVVVHGAASVGEDPNLPEMLEGDAYANWVSGYGPYRAFNDSIGDLNEMYTVHGKIALGAMIDGGGGGTWTFGQTDRGAEFRVGGWNFSDYSSGAGRRFHSYQRNDWVPGGDSWIIRGNDNFYMGYPVCVEAAAPGEIRWADFKAEKDYRGEQGGICEKGLGGPPWGDAFQIAEFTADYSGMYYMTHLHGSVSCPNYVHSYLFAKNNPADAASLPRVIRETEEMWCEGVSHCAITDPQTYGFTGSLVGSFGCREPQSYPLTKGASYVLVTHISDEGWQVSSGFPFWQYDKSRLLDIAPGREVKQAVAAIPLVKPGATIDGRIWREDSLTDCTYNGSESGVSVDISLTKDGTEEASSSNVDSYLYAVSEPGDYMVTINNIPADYTMSDDCKGSLFTCDQANHQCWNSFPLAISQNDIDSGLAFEVNFPLADLSTIMGTLEVNVWDESSTIDACGSYDAGENLPSVNISITDSSGGTVYSGPSSGYSAQLVDPAKTYTVTAVLPANYMHSGCGFIQTGNNWSKSGIIVAAGTTTSIDLPLLPYGSISGTVYEDPFPNACVTGFGVVNDNSLWEAACGGTYQEIGADFSCTKLELGTIPITISAFAPWQHSCSPDTPSGTIVLDPANPDGLVRFMLTQSRAAWFQVTGGDIHANNGGIQSLIPGSCGSPGCAPYLFLSGAGGYPGFASWTSGAISWGDGNLSDNGSYKWKANSGSYDGSLSLVDLYSNFAYLEENAVSWTSISDVSADGIWETTTSPFVIGGAGWDISNKVVILHNGTTLNINGNIEVAENRGSLVVISSGTINISSSATQLEGIYIADTINTGTGDQILTVEGSLIGGGGGGVNLQRNLDADSPMVDPHNAVNPAEKIIYRPDIVVNAHDDLRRHRYSGWQEVAP